MVALKHLTINMSLYDDPKQLTATANGSKIARTVTDEFGLVPSAAMKGDIIAFLAGTDHASLIRKVDNHYVLVGPARLPVELADPIVATLESNSREEIFEMIELR